MADTKRNCTWNCSRVRVLCSTRILHFDIKPHNILLDDEFRPKISDFGLAKLCLGEESIISMQDMRGTPSYIAPEIFSRNFRGVSHKSDVYSYGMMILEMVGAKNNIHEEVIDCSSEKCFPDWIYDRLELNADQIGLDGILNEVETESTRKLMIVGLWCMQTHPSERPSSMKRVLEMLEGNAESLRISVGRLCRTFSKFHQNGKSRFFAKFVHLAAVELMKIWILNSQNNKLDNLMIALSLSSTTQGTFCYVRVIWENEMRGLSIYGLVLHDFETYIPPG